MRGFQGRISGGGEDFKEVQYIRGERISGGRVSGVRGF